VSAHRVSVAAYAAKTTEQMTAVHKLLAAAFYLCDLCFHLGGTAKGALRESLRRNQRRPARQFGTISFAAP